MAAKRLFIDAERALQSTRLSDAIRLFGEAERQGYDADLCSANRWTCYMLQGEFETAWYESDRISARGRPDPNRFWDGTSVEGRDVLIRCLHGLGDTLQFIRYVHLLRKRVSSLIIESQPSLKTLLSRAQVADQVITWGEPDPRWNQQIEVIELPRVFRTTLQSIPNHVPYLSVQGVAAAPYDGSRPLNAGFVWAGSSYNSARSLRLEEFAPLLNIPGIRFFSFQSEPQRAQLRHWAGKVNDAETGAVCTLATAERLNSMDLVITVDTMMAHLAGAMGRPVWTLLPFACDWRWMLEREDSPWYPTMRLFRQPRPGDWAHVIENVGERLRRVLRGAPLVFPASEPPLPYSGSRTGPGNVK